MKLELPSDRKGHGVDSTQNMIPEERPLIGLDFGTTNTVLSNYIHNFNSKGPQTVGFSQTGSDLYPSFALYNPSDGKYITGQVAYRRRMMEPEKIIRSVKRSLDREFIIVSGVKVRPHEVVESICHDVLKQLRDINHQTLPQTIVATVPYHFLQKQNVLIRNAVNSACIRIFGKSPEVYIIPEPVAAALYWLYIENGKLSETDVRTLIFDLGGGTFDLSYLRLSIKDKRIESEIVATTGASAIGGDDIDQLIYNHIVEEGSVDISSLPDKMRVKVKSDLMDAAIEAKHELTYRTETAIVNKVGDIDIVLQRETLEKLLDKRTDGQSSFMERIEATVAKIADMHSVRQMGFDYVILVGGPTKMPVIRDYIKRRFPKARILTQPDSKDHTCVALGASVYAAMVTEGVESPFGIRMTLDQFRSRTPYNYYIEKYDGKLDLIVKAGQICPVSVKKTYRPTHLKEGDELVDLTSIRIFQGPDVNKAVYIGSIDIGKEKIYAHGRKASDIAVEVELTADSTILVARINVASGQQNKSPFNKEITIQI